MSLNRVTPQGPSSAYQTFRIRRPKGEAGRLLWDRNVPCARAGCQAFEHGWITRVDEGTTLGQAQAHYIRRESGRSFNEVRDPSAVHSLTSFYFAAGQECFAGKHDVPTEAEPLFIVAGGDWRGNPRGIAPRVHRNAVEWVEEFGENQDTLRDRIARG